MECGRNGSGDKWPSGDESALMWAHVVPPDVSHGYELTWTQKANERQLLGRRGCALYVG